MKKIAKTIITLSLFGTSTLSSTPYKSSWSKLKLASSCLEIGATLYVSVNGAESGKSNRLDHSKQAAVFVGCFGREPVFQFDEHMSSLPPSALLSR